MKMTIQEMNNAIETMKKIYNFKDEKTMIKLGGRFSFDEGGVRLATTDEETGVDIQMSKEFEVKPYV